VSRNLAGAQLGSGFLQQLRQRFLCVRLMAAVLLINNLVVLIEHHHLHRGGADVNAGMIALQHLFSPAWGRVTFAIDASSA